MIDIPLQAVELLIVCLPVHARIFFRLRAHQVNEVRAFDRSSLYTARRLWPTTASPNPQLTAPGVRTLPAFRRRLRYALGEEFGGLAGSHHAGRHRRLLPPCRLRRRSGCVRVHHQFIDRKIRQALFQLLFPAQCEHASWDGNKVAGDPDEGLGVRGDTKRGHCQRVLYPLRDAHMELAAQAHRTIRGMMSAMPSRSICSSFHQDDPRRNFI